MICDKCGNNLAAKVRCPNCGYDNSKTDDAPVETRDFRSDPLVDIEEPELPFLEKTDLKTTAPKEVSLRCTSPELYEYANYSYGVDIFWICATIVFVVIMILLKNNYWIPLSFFIFYLLDILFNMLLNNGKESVLAVYIPFSILFFPLLALSDILVFFGTRSRTNRAIRLVKSRFFIKDFKSYLTYRREEKEMRNSE